MQRLFHNSRRVSKVSRRRAPDSPSGQLDPAFRDLRVPCERAAARRSHGKTCMTDGTRCGMAHLPRAAIGGVPTPIRGGSATRPRGDSAGACRKDPPTDRMAAGESLFVHSEGSNSAPGRRCGWFARGRRQTPRVRIRARRVPGRGGARIPSASRGPVRRSATRRLGWFPVETGAPGAPGGPRTYPAEGRASG